MSEPTVRQLEREAEAARARLAMDLDTLTSPRTMAGFKQDVRAEAMSAKDALIGNAQSTVTSAFENIVEDLKAKAMANPTAALAIGAGIAWRLLHRPPVATVLIGAGLYSLLRTVPSEHPAQTAAVSQAVEAIDAASVKVQQWSAQASALAQESTETAKEWGAQAGAVARDSAETVKEWGAQAGKVARDSAETMKEWGSQAGAVARDSAETVKDWGSQAATLAQRSAAGLRDTGRDIQDLTLSAGDQASDALGNGKLMANEMASKAKAAANQASVTVTNALQDEDVRDKVLLSAAALAVAAALGMAYQRRAADNA